MKDLAKVVLALAFVASVIVGGVALSWAHWSECRRLHPWWYCAGSK